MVAMVDDAHTPAATPADGPETPRRGRPRSTEAQAAILAAMLELAGEVGIAGMSMDDLAHRAGVSKATIYRWWSSKEALVLDALRSALSPFDDIDTGALRSDLEVYLGELAERMGRGPINDVLPHLIEVSCHDETLRSSLDEYVHHRRTPLRAILTRAAERGELPPDADVDVLIDTLLGAFVYRRLLSRDPLDESFVERLLTTVLG